MTPATRPFYVGGRATRSEAAFEVQDKYSGETLAHVSEAGAAHVEAALAAAHAARAAMQALPAHGRRRALDRCAERLDRDAAALAAQICAETGKPIRDARAEVARATETFRIAAEEAVRIGGDVLPLDRGAATAGRLALTRRFPVGVVSLITPFNFPLNLVAHKVAPAIAAGCPFVLKPSPLTPLSALSLGALLEEAGLPPGAFSIVTCSHEAAAPLVGDPRVALLSFTGSAQVGWALRTAADRKRVVLELGGNAAVLLDASMDLPRAVERCVVGAFYQAGQSCISVQRIFVHRARYAELREALVAATRALPWGDPRDEGTFVGPLIAEREARRLERWVADAVRAGATVLSGGQRHGATFEPTLLEGVAPGQPLRDEEAFGPVALLEPVDSFEAGLACINDSRFGLQAGVFTAELAHALRAWEALEVGAVLINEVPSWRADAMPYGGVKESGLGREGISSAIAHMTEPRLLVLPSVAAAP